MFFLDIEALQNQGIGAADITKLRVAGICTVRVCYVPSYGDSLIDGFVGRFDGDEEELVQNHGSVGS